MLTKRTNILFDEETWKKLVKLSKEEEKSVGELVRVAIDEYYNLDDDVLKRIREACGFIEKNRKRLRRKIDYKTLIDYGRRI